MQISLFFALNNKKSLELLENRICLQMGQNSTCSCQKPSENNDFLIMTS